MVDVLNRSPLDIFVQKTLVALNVASNDSVFQLVVAYTM